MVLKTELEPDKQLHCAHDRGLGEISWSVDRAWRPCEKTREHKESPQGEQGGAMALMDLRDL